MHSTIALGSKLDQLVGVLFFNITFLARKKIPGTNFFLFAVVDNNKFAHFVIRRRLLLFFRHFLLFVVAENKIKGAFRHSE